ncbi:recombinase family protein [Streptomyces lydicus]
MNGDVMAPLVFIYDRCASRNHRDLDMRLVGCHTYVDRMGWALAGRGPWRDLGPDALSTHRPALATMAEAMQEAAGHREVLCLVHTWGRLATDETHRLVLQQRIIEAGGYTLTTFGESDRHTLRAVLVGRGT